MKKLKHGKVILYAAAIILVCAGALIISINVAFGAEENKVIADAAADDETALSPTSTVSSGITVPAQFITEAEAIDAFMNIAKNVCGLDIIPNEVGALFIEKRDLTDNKGAIIGIQHDEWAVEGRACTCYIDALSGDVIFFENNNEYSKEGTTVGEWDEAVLSGSYGGYYEDPNNIYIQTAKNIVNASLADGRSIDHVQIDGVQFAWDDNNAGFESDATGTLLVDCHVYMETGVSYTISLWGDTDNLQVYWFYSHPTWDACKWMYYYEEDAHVLPSEADEWQTAPGITEGGYIE